MAWDDTKSSGDLIKSQDWNDMVADQKARLKKMTDSRIIYVDSTNGDDSSGTGSVDNPYKTIARAAQEVPDSITQPLTIHLKASNTTYDALNIANKLFSDTNGSFTIEGEFNTLDSGTVSSFVFSDTDPHYSNVRVYSITDSNKSWTTDAYKWKLAKITASNGTINYRIITNNSSNKLFFSHKLPSSLDLTNATYEILDWASVIDNIFISNFNGPVTIRNLKVHPASASYAVDLQHCPSSTIYQCEIDKTKDGGAGVLTVNSYIRLSDCFMEGYKTNYDGVLNSYSFNNRLEFFGVIMHNFRYGLSDSAELDYIFFRGGSRIIADSDSSVSKVGIVLRSPSVISFYSPLGDNLIDVPGNALSVSGAIIQYDNYLHKGPLINSPDQINFSQNANGNIFLVKPVIESHPPSSSSDSGIKGQITWDSSYFYVCVDDNTWKRINLNSF